MSAHFQPRVSIGLKQAFTMNSQACTKRSTSNTLERTPALSTVAAHALSTNSPMFDNPWQSDENTE